MAIFKRGKVYWFEIIFNKERYRHSTKATNRVVATQVEAAYRIALVKGEAGITERKRLPTFDVSMKGFLAWSVTEHHAHPSTAHRYKISSAALLRFFKKQKLDAITSEEVERFKTERARENGQRTGRRLKPATVNRELACLRAMFNHVMKGDVLLRNPVSRVKFLAEDNQQDRVLKFAEQRKYLAAATVTLQDVAGLMLETGMRPEEVYTLRDTNVDLDQGFLRVLKGKTPAAKRRIDLTDEARRIVETRMEKLGPGYLFPHDRDSSRRIPQINNAHDRALRDSGVAKFRLYDLRHTWATRAAEAGIDLVTLAAMMGHSRIQMVMRYAHPTQTHQTSAMEQFARHSSAAEAKEKALARLAEERKAGSPTLAIMRKA